jgi:D-arabinose 1-dehydrogenase-like Zn-dependent alcohol dehydrogenase
VIGHGLAVDGGYTIHEEISMRGTVLYGPRDIRFEERPDPTILKPTDAIVRIAATSLCGSDLWP